MSAHQLPPLPPADDLAATWKYIQHGIDCFLVLELGDGIKPDVVGIGAIKYWLFFALEANF